jgi:hypothetical protein
MTPMPPNPRQDHLKAAVARRFRLPNPYSLYCERYANLDRGALRKIDPRLYQRLRHAGLLHKVPAGVRAQKTRSRSTDPLAEYQVRYCGMARGELAQHDQALYQRLRRKNLLSHIPTVPPLNDPLTAYRASYGDVTRGELAKRNKGLYLRLYKANLLHHVPTARTFFPDPLGFYRTHYPGVTRGTLAIRNRSLYDALRSRGLLNKLPKKVRPSSDDPAAPCPIDS